MLRPFRRTRLLILAAAAAAVLGSAPAAAQFSRPLPPAAIVSALRDRGFEDFSRLRLDGTTYRLDATNRRGERVALVVDAYDAEILERAFRDRDDAILPPRDVGPRTSRSLPPGRYDQRPPLDDGLPPLDDQDEEEEESRAGLDDLPVVPAPIYRESLPPQQDFGTRDPGPRELGARDLGSSNLGPQELSPLGRPAPVDTLGEPVRREAERAPPPPRTNPLALPDRVPEAPAPRTATPGVQGPSSTSSRPAPGVAPVPRAPAGPVAATPAAPKPPAAEPKPEQKNAGAAPAPRSTVRIIGGVTPVIPRDTPEGAKPN